MSYSSPASARDKQGDDLHFRRINTEKSITTQGAINSPLTPAIPKAKNPDLQESFEAAYKWGEKFNKRILLGIRKDKTAEESAQRRLELEKFRAKAPSYAPYQSQTDKSNPADRDVDDQLRIADEDCFRYLEQLIACVTAAAKPAETNTQGPALSALEAKVEQISEVVAKQAQQNQRLLDDNTNLRSSIISLEAAYNSMEAANNDLKTKYDALKSDHAALQLKSRSVDEKMDVLYSQRADLESETKEMRKKFDDLQFNTEKTFQSSREEMTGFTKTTSNSTESRKAAEAGLKECIDGIITRLDAFTADFNEMKDKLDELDMVTFNEMCDAWMSTEYNMKTQYEEYIRRCNRGDSSVDDTIQSLRREMDSLRDSQTNAPQVPKEGDAWLQTVEAIIDNKVAAAEEAINNQNREFCEKRDNEYADIIDGAAVRIIALEQGTLKRSEAEARFQLLEKRKATGSIPTARDPDPNLVERVTRLESNKVSHRVDRIDLDVGNLSRKLESLQGEVGQLVKREWVDLRLQEILPSVGMNPSFVDDVRELQRKLGVLEHAVLTLDTQFQNLSTKPLADQIVRLVSPGLEQRFGELETKASKLESKTKESDKIIFQHAEKLKTLAALLNSIIPSAKRTASPGQSEEPSKKRRLEANGRHPSPLQQQHQNDPSNQPQSS